MTDTPDLDLAFYHLQHCTQVGKHCQALMQELRRLYRAAGEPVPPYLEGAELKQVLVWYGSGTALPVTDRPPDFVYTIT